jgi:hypothetical protein
MLQPAKGSKVTRMGEELVERIKHRALEVAPSEPGWEQVAAVLDVAGKDLDLVDRYEW